MIVIYSGQLFQIKWTISDAKHDFQGVRSRASSMGINFRNRSAQMEALSFQASFYPTSSLLSYSRLVIVAYHPQANGLVER